VEGEVDLVGDALPHGLGLPPGDVVGVVEVGQVQRRVGLAWSAGAPIARLVVGLTRLYTELDFVVTLLAASVSRLHLHAEGRVFELGHASLKSPKSNKKIS